MQSFSRGWSFLKQAWGMAFSDKDLLKPTIYTLIVGAIVGVIGVIPIAIAAFALGGSDFGNVVVYGMSAVLIFVQFVVTYVFSAMTAYLIYQYLTEGDGKMETAWAIVRRDFFDILTLAAASTLVNLLKNASQRGRRRGNIIGGAVSAGAGLLSTLWTEAATLILPAMVIDDLNLKQGLERVWKITKENLLLVGVSFIGVRAITGLITFVFLLIGIVAAVVVVGGVQLAGASSALTVISIILAVLIIFAFMMVASVISAYTNTAYHTCLYIWAREAEKAVERGGSANQALAPAPLAAVLSAS
ncbi:MAG: hypothetical protein LC099_02665 [Anaerolineales bacterium]|nr:hypothetical protein [Anaerolineales bacterium]